MITTYILISLAALFGGFASAAGGGGGILTTATLLLVGLPPHVVLGTNKLITSANAFSSATLYMKRRVLRLSTWIASMIAVFVGAIVGVALACWFDARTLSILLPIIIALLALYYFFPQSRVNEISSAPSRAGKIINLIVSFAISVYGGFFGAGVGLMWPVAGEQCFRLSRLEAIALGRLMCLITNITALIVFMWFHQVDYMLGIVASAFGFFGSYLGVHVSFKLNPAVLRRSMASMALLMSVYLLLH